jgi:hypothetical protein
MMCCGGRNRPNPTPGAAVDCGGATRTFAPDAYVIAVKGGLDLCAIAGTGLDGMVTRLDVLRALGR